MGLQEGQESGHSGGPQKVVPPPSRSHGACRARTNWPEDVRVRLGGEVVRNLPSGQPSPQKVPEVARYSAPASRGNCAGISHECTVNAIVYAGREVWLYHRPAERDGHGGNVLGLLGIGRWRIVGSDALRLHTPWPFHLQRVRQQEAGMTVRDAGAVACHAGQGLS